MALLNDSARSGRSLREDRVQRLPGDRHCGVAVPFPPAQRHLRKQLPVVITKSIRVALRSRVDELLVQTQASKNVHSVRGKLEPAPDLRFRWVPVVKYCPPWYASNKQTVMQTRLQNSASVRPAMPPQQGSPHPSRQLSWWIE